MISTTKQPLYNRIHFLSVSLGCANVISVQSFQLIRFDTHCWCDFKRLIEQMAHLLILLLLLLPTRTLAAPPPLMEFTDWLGYCNALFIHPRFTWFHVIDVLLQSVRRTYTIDCTKYTKSELILWEKPDSDRSSLPVHTDRSVCLSVSFYSVCTIYSRSVHVKCMQ